MEMTNHHSGNDKLTAAAINDVAREWARAMEGREVARSGTILSIARKAVARRIGVPAGTLETLRSGRRKGVPAWLFQKLQSSVINEIKAEIERCAHELEMARQCGLDPRSDEMAALETAMSRARKVIGDKT